MPETDPFSHCSGPRNAKIAIVGEAWGEQEDLTGRPFAGLAGQELTKMLSEVGIERKQCFLTNVFNVRPPANNIEYFLTKKEDAGKGALLPPFAQGKYVREEYLPHLERVREEILTVRPNLILALGNTSCWAMLGYNKITQIRGTTTLTKEGIKILPTFHPSYVLRNWEARTIVIADLMKAKRESEFPEVRRPERTVLINPTLEEIRTYCYADHQILSVDIETTKKQVASIGFASSRTHSIVIPFITDEAVPKSYWVNESDEVLALRYVKHLLERPIPKLFQNGMYDLQYLVSLSIRPAQCLHDTMLLHHSLYPEMRKGLGFLGSIYSDEQSWKLLGGRTDSTKREE